MDFPAICHGNPVAVEGKSEFRQAKFGECLKYLKGAARKQVLEALHPKKNHGASAGSCADMELPGVFFLVKGRDWDMALTGGVQHDAPLQLLSQTLSGDEYPEYCTVLFFFLIFGSWNQALYLPTTHGPFSRSLALHSWLLLK